MDIKIPYSQCCVPCIYVAKHSGIQLQEFYQYNFVFCFGHPRIYWKHWFLIVVGHIFVTPFELLPLFLLKLLDC